MFGCIKRNINVKWNQVLLAGFKKELEKFIRCNDDDDDGGNFNKIKTKE